MKYHILGGLTATMLGAFFEVPQLSHAQSENQSNQLDSSLQSASSGASSSPDPPGLEGVEGPTNADLAGWLSPSSRPVTLFPHRHGQQPGITLYVRSIPVMTLLSPGPLSPEEAEGLRQSDPAEESPALVERAIHVASRLESFAQQAEDPAHIQVRWQGDQKNFVIYLGDADLLVVDEAVRSFHPSQDMAAEALKITNRLRYLLGDAPPLEKIDGMPEAAPPAPAAPQIAAVLTGVASWYGPGFHGRRSASGEVFDQHAMTAAHRSLPFGTRVRVTNLSNGRQVVVRINDRGPFIYSREIDLSAGAATALDMTHSGVARVRLEVLRDL